MSSRRSEASAGIHFHCGVAKSGSWTVDPDPRSRRSLLRDDRGTQNSTKLAKSCPTLFWRECQSEYPYGYTRALQWPLHPAYWGGSLQGTDRPCGCIEWRQSAASATPPASGSLDLAACPPIP
jgi:hypothetical protein